VNQWTQLTLTRRGDADDPWGFGNSLEWATMSPPPRHNFLELPRIRSERPAFELHYPHLSEQMRDEAHSTREHSRPRTAPVEAAAAVIQPDQGDSDPRDK
jgi:cytochrome c oxidase subunit I